MNDSLILEKLLNWWWQKKYTLAIFSQVFLTLIPCISFWGKTTEANKLLKTDANVAYYLIGFSTRLYKNKDYNIYWLKLYHIQEVWHNFIDANVDGVQIS